MINNSNSPAPRLVVKADDVDRWIDIHDHDLMVSLGMQQPYYEGRDPSVWEKSLEEKAKLAEDKREKIYEALSSPKFKKSFIENVLKSTALKLSPKKAVPVANVENEIDAAQNDKQHLPGM